MKQYRYSSVDFVQENSNIPDTVMDSDELFRLKQLEISILKLAKDMLEQSATLLKSLLRMI